MSNKVIILNQQQNDELEKQLCDIAANCGMDEEDNAQYKVMEVAIGELVLMIEFWIMCTSSWYEPATYDYPADWGCSINIDIRKAYTCIDDDEQEAEVMLAKTEFDFDF